MPNYLLYSGILISFFILNSILVYSNTNPSLNINHNNNHIMSSFDKKERKHVLVTGGAGYIGTHTILCLLDANYDVTIVDNLINSSEESINRIRELSQCELSRITFHKVDLCNYNELESVFLNSPTTFDSCIHFAGLKAVGESVAKPLLYYENNIGGTINLLNLMSKYKCHSIVFSSSATVYGSADVPITEDTQTGLGITNAYGRTKYMIEEILKDFKQSKDLATNIEGDTPWSVVILRYFNPVGAHPSGRIGEDPNGIPNNLMPYVNQVVVGRREKLTIFGNDYDTKDGTGVRDYIHVMDLADGHVAALKYINSIDNNGYGKYSVFNLGTGIGYSVLDMVEAMKKSSQRPLPYEFGPRRPGDIAICYADPTKARELLGWNAKRSLTDMCSDSWNWQSSNPNGYSSSSSSTRI